jgi:hypothetical protein
MAGSSRVVALVLRCYPARWKTRHGEEAAELADLLMQDGTPARSIAFSYLAGAARAQLTTGPARRLGAATAAAAVAAASLGTSLALVSSPPAAGAASVVHGTSHPQKNKAGTELRTLLRTRCGLLGQTPAQALATLRPLHARVSWAGFAPGTGPDDQYRVTGGRVLGSGTIVLRVAAAGTGDRHDGVC